MPRIIAVVPLVVLFGYIVYEAPGLLLILGTPFVAIALAIMVASNKWPWDPTVWRKET